MSDLSVLMDMLSYCRPKDSADDAEFRTRFILPHQPFADPYGNLRIAVPCADGSPSRVLWSCHTDTVHHFGGRQTLCYKAPTGMLSLSKRSKRQGRNCLGADDTAGVWLCLELIKAHVPGMYVFHYGEECGAWGSSDIAEHDADWLSTFDMAIAFDRRGTSDVITHQFGQRTASHLFALSLAVALHEANPVLCYAPAHGIFTDTALYADLTPECSNLSVGYANEHTRDECLDTQHLFALRDALLKVDMDTILVDRDLADSVIEADPRSWILPLWLRDEQNDVPADYYLDQVHADVQHALRGHGRSLVRFDCDLCGTVTYGDTLHDCPYTQEAR